MAKKVVSKKSSSKAKTVSPTDTTTPSTHVQTLSATCGCDRTSTFNLPMPARLHVMEIHVFCHECKQTVMLKGSN